MTEPICELPSTRRAAPPFAVRIGLGGLATGLALLASCGGSSSEPVPGSGPFFLDGTNVSNGQTWQINRVIRFVFSRPVDFSTVNLNTINIAEPTGEAAIGEFVQSPSDPSVIEFVPRCPTQPDLSDAGLLPGGVTYRIRIPDQATGAGSVRSIAGSGIEISQTYSFVTPATDFLPELFLDPVPGPPAPVEGAMDPDTGVVTGTRLEFEDGTDPLPFELSSEGFGTLGDYLVPLNLYSDVTSRTSVVVEVNQPVNPLPANIDSNRIQLQFLSGTTWTGLPTRVELIANCVAPGAAVRLTPTGVLPQNRMLRVWLGPEFEDLVGDRNILPLDKFAVMNSRTFTDPAGDPTEFADELLEEFLVGGADSLEDTTAVFETPRANWGGGRLTPAFAFTGTGGPGGDFDWHIQPNTDFVLDTTSTLIFGGPGGLPESSQLVVNGIVNIRNLTIPASSSLRIQGPNPALFLCSGSVQIDGLLACNGNNAQPVFSVNQPNIPEAGASGNAGGGDGGVGSFLTNQVTQFGGPGQGAYGASSQGGVGGESGWHPNNFGGGIARRCAGGGGGVFGFDVIDASSGCPDQSLIGLDAESGFPGETFTNSALRPGEFMPWGGMQGPSPFVNESSLDDFWGTMVRNFASSAPTQVAGELPDPWAGSGGGAGGDATRSSTYPPPTLIFEDQDKGAGGGGGGGSLTLLVLGDVNFGPAGRVEANGGHGSGGENTSGTNRIGGGSGGGSGGHIVIQSGSQIDLSQVPTNVVALVSRGGQGGAGALNVGGATTVETAPTIDGAHIGVTGPADMSDNPWIPPVPANCLPSMSPGVIRCAGGDGGPGLIQLHVSVLPDDVIPPGGTPGDSVTLAGATQPPPIGYLRSTGQWQHQLVPLFGRISKSQSKWVPMGLVAVDPDSETLQPIEFLFAGTDPADGRVLTSDGTVVDLPPLLAPAEPVEGSGLPSIDPEDPFTLLMDATELTGDDEIYRLNPQLLRRFRLEFAQAVFDVEAATVDAEGNVLSLSVPSTGAPLPTTGQVELVPRFFGVVTSAVADALPDSARVTIEFQAAPRDPDTGDPDLTDLVPPSPDASVWATDVDDLNQASQNPELQFYRFRVTFEIGIGETDLSFSSPRPTLDFFRLPVRF